MKISFNWLSQYIDLKNYRKQPQDLAAILTQAGLEVEAMSNPAENWNGVVVGHLLEVGKHPDADKLTVCKVDVGTGTPLQIVCGAKNHKTGDYVAVAQVGTVLPGDFKIKQSKIRGVDSSGMLCSETELGLSEESEGILLLAGKPKVGQSLAELPEYADIVFELKVTPNRADCLSHIGLARELATQLDQKVQLPEAPLSEAGKDINGWIDVELKDSQDCPRYCGRMISGVKIGPSPDWLKKALDAVGVNSVNNVVDVTNYVLFEYGQPLHAFDYATIKNSKITIEKAKDGEVFRTLDGTEIKLSSQDLVIRDGARAVALAGVVGGQNSGVSDATTDIFLESAFFRAQAVRKTSRTYGIETDSCYRFSRGVDPAQTLNAMDRAAFLIQKTAGGVVQKGHIDIYPEPIQFSPIAISTAYVSERLGFAVSDDDFKNWMERLGCQVTQKAGLFYVTSPSFRWDLNIKEDLVEEYARLHGYDAIDETLPALLTAPSRHNDSYVSSTKVSDILTGFGLSQAVNYAFIGKGQNEVLWANAQSTEKWGLPMGETIELVNPLSEELSVMRPSLLPSLLKNTVFNNNHGNHNGKIFELGSAHYCQGSEFKEDQRLALMSWGQVEDLWTKSKTNQVIFDLKSTVESLLVKLGGKNWRWDVIPADLCPSGFHPNQTVSLFYEGKAIGILGTLHPLLNEKFKLRTQVAMAEFNFDLLMNRQPRMPKFQSLPIYPGTERDVAFLVKETLRSDEIIGEIKKAAGPLLTQVSVFDIYQDEQLRSSGRKSIAYRLRFQSPSETLNDETVNGLRDKVVNSLSQKLGLEIR